MTELELRSPTGGVVSISGVPADEVEELVDGLLERGYVLIELEDERS